MFYDSNMPLPRLLTFLIAAGLCAQAAAQPANGLADYTLEELSQVVVSSVARQEASLASAAVSIQRISRAEIRRYGATTLPEALRLASHLHVARVNSGNYSITARGFSAEFENKMLVMIDGRSVYSPLFSGVFWDVQDLLLEDIERIEVISGPGSTIWGTNAVNGVINVITRKAHDSTGSYGRLGAGNDERVAAARFGARLPNGGAYRLYAKYAGHDDLENEAGAAVRGRWRHRQAGFRTDFGAGAFTATVSGDVYARRQGAGLSADMEMSGANLNGRIERKLDDGSLRLQAYLDQASRTQLGARDRIRIADFEVQHDFRAGERHALSWGGGYRVARDRVDNGPTLQFTPDRRTLHWANVFLQDQIVLRPDLHLTLGTRFEQTSYTGVEWLPTARLAWQVPAGGLWWLGAARTVRAPSRFDRELSIRALRSDGSYRQVLVPNPAFESELARVAELGYRGNAGPHLQYSAVAYRTDYDDLRSYTVQPGGVGMFTNQAMGRVRGIELQARWQVTPHWQLSAGAVAQDVDLWSKPGMGGTPSGGNDPSHYWRLHSAHNFGHGIELDVEWRHVSRLPQPAVPSYHELDARLAWHVTPGLEASITGRNLLHSAHPEFGPAATRQLVGRSVLFNLSWRY